MRPEYANHQTEASVVAALASPVVTTVNGKPFVLLPGEEPALLAKALDPPAHVKQSLEIQTLDGLREFLKMHGEALETVVFADRKGLRLSVVFDYHLAEDCPNHCENRARFRLEPDERFERFRRVFRQWISQELLIDLIEENEAVFQRPASAEMLALAQHLEIHQKSKVVARRSARNGTGALAFETSEGEETTKVPERVVLGLPVYQGLYDAEGRRKAWLVDCRLRYRVAGGEGVQFMLVPSGLEELLDSVWREIVDGVRLWDRAVVVEGAEP
jgi:hypothetical protein